MSERSCQLKEITLRDFRCFRERQTAPLAPLTLLVGENSTGKTSFLAAVRAICDVAFHHREPDFREPPYDLGSFPEIVHDRGGRGSKAETFEIGIRALGSKPGLLECNATFKSGMSAAPSVSGGHAAAEDLWFKWCPTDGGRVKFELGSDNETWNKDEIIPADAHDLISLMQSAFLYTDFGRLPPLRNSTGELEAIGVADHQQPVLALIASFQYFINTRARLFASAPIHAIPRRTYDPVKLDDDPWGADVPSRLASLQFRDKFEWTVLKEKLDAFGRESGLFDDLSVKQLTGFEGGPFQLQIRKFGKKGRKGPKRNLMDVGFGISQVLPVLAALFRADGPPMFLLQQPELHLHPSAQAALGSLFCRTAEAGRQLIVETHGDYIMNRIRLDVRDRRTNLKPEDVMLLYFERDDLDVRIHPIGFDGDGNVQDAPPNYRRFFTDELNRSLDY